MQKCKIPIKGMHCRSCEILIEDELTKIPGIAKATVDHKQGTAEIFYKHKLNEDAVEQAINSAGYTWGYEEKTYVSKKFADYKELGLAVLIVMGLYLVAKNLGVFELGQGIKGNYSNLGIVFVIGLTAGVSTCMALVGGLILGASARFAETHPEASNLEKFKPHLWFNLGRIGAYFVLGGVIGLAGSFFQLSTSVLGILTVAVGAVMLLLGGQLIEIFPILKRVSLTMPKSIGRWFGISERASQEYSHKNSAIMGALTFFLPCGFTQAMQLYAMSTGSPVAGAMTMGVFAIGTAPGLLGVGGLSSAVKGNGAKLFFKTAGVVVILLAVFNISNGLNLIGVNPLTQFAKAFEGATASATTSTDPNVTLVNGVQEVRMQQTSSGYSPNKFTIKKGVPVKWIINSENPNSCAASIVASQLGIRQSLQGGENVITFTAKETGTIRFSCSMGMYNGVFNVTDDNGQTSETKVNNVTTAAPATQTAAAGSCGGGGGGCGCGGGAAKTTQIDPNVTPQAATNQGQVQLIKATYSVDTDILPNKFTVKANKPVRFEIAAKDNGQGCMGSVTLPNLSSKVDLFTKGKTTVFEFTPTQAGNFNITCGMGIPRGQILVI